MSSTFFEFYIEEIPTEENSTNNFIMYDKYGSCSLYQTQEMYMTFSSNFAKIEEYSMDIMHFCLIL